MDHTEWIEQAMQALSTIKGRTSAQRKQAIIAVVTAKIEGRSVASVFKAPDAPCDRAVYYKWMGEDPDFRAASETVERLARAYLDESMIADLQKAKRRLVAVAPAAVMELARLLQDGDPRVRLSAANSILDRAAMDTAQKVEAAQTHAINADTMAALIADAQKKRGELV